MIFVPRVCKSDSGPYNFLPYRSICIISSNQTPLDSLNPPNLQHECLFLCFLHHLDSVDSTHHLNRLVTPPNKCHKIISLYSMRVERQYLLFCPLGGCDRKYVVSLITAYDLIKIEMLECWSHGSNTQSASERVRASMQYCVWKIKKVIS